MRCIYCLEDKDASAFEGREHVTPQAFGLFTNNLVLKCVCDDCNGYFGREVNLKLARDSPEAFDRITVGLKPATEFESLGKRSTSHVEFQEGPLAGGKGYAVASRDGETLGVLAFPQVWFAHSADGPYEKFRADTVPTKEGLIARGYKPGTPLFVRTFEIEDPTAFLASKGFKLDGNPQRLDEQPEGRVLIENVLRIAEPEFRAATKIALNYLAAVVGWETALDPIFADARNFARYGKPRGRVRVYAFENRWFLGRKGHYVSLRRAEDMIVAQLSLLMRTQYIVVLADGDASVTISSTAHVFDLDDGRLKSRPQPFGYKCAWLAIKGTTPTKVRDAIPVVRAKEATWQEGIAAVYEFDLTRRRVFVTPEVNGWVFAMSPLGLPAEKVARDLTVRLSAQLETTVQFFATHRVVELHVWVVATAGKLIRAFGYVGESDAVLFDEGKPTAAERSPRVTARRVPNEETVLSIAGAWSIDPRTLGDVEGGDGRGLLGEIGSQ